MNYNLAHDIRQIGIGASRQRIVAALAQRDRQTSYEMDNPVEIPALRQALRHAPKSTIEGNCPDVAEHEIVGGVEGRKRATQAGIEKIHPLAEA